MQVSSLTAQWTSPGWATQLQWTLTKIVTPQSLSLGRISQLPETTLARSTFDCIAPARVRCAGRQPPGLVEFPAYYNTPCHALKATQHSLDIKKASPS
ncbi:hypothetical protein LA080_007449 [Diaporthe eres]|nr:hypothetical protein LA080_007449 [Diaporthe eres]